MPEFAHACVRAGYEAGAKQVIVRWEDDVLTRLNMEMAGEEDLCAMKPYELRSYLDYAEDPTAAARWQSMPKIPKHWLVWMQARSTG